MKKYTSILILLSCFLVLLSTQIAFSSSEEITARYLQPRGTKISWKIFIPSPPPAAVIVTQSIPAGTVIKSSSPQFNSYDQEAGTAKWLLDNVTPGTVIMKMELDTPIRKKGEISGEIIFQDQTAKPIAELSTAPSFSSP